MTTMMLSLLLALGGAHAEPPEEITRTFTCERHTTKVTMSEAPDESYLVQGLCGDQELVIQLKWPSANREIFYRCAAGFDTYYEVWQNGVLIDWGHLENMHCSEDMEWWEA